MKVAVFTLVYDDDNTTSGSNATCEFCKNCPNVHCRDDVFLRKELLPEGGLNTAGAQRP
jgi:hypothetical protein